MDEYLDLFDENRSPIGKTALKSEIHKKGLWHVSVDIWLYDGNGNLIIQKRASNKDTYPNCWDVSVAGHVKAGEKPLEAIKREVLEELGIALPLSVIEYIDTFDIITTHNSELIDKEFHYVYAAPLDLSAHQLQLQVEEVAAIELLSIEKLNNFDPYQGKTNFVKYPKSYLNSIGRHLKNLNKL